MRRCLLLLLCLLLTGAPWATAQDATVVDPEHYRVVLENDHVRVLRISYGPGEKSVMHSHPAGPAIFHTDMKAQMTMPDGSTTVMEAMAGDVVWSPGGQHHPVNLADQPLVVFQVELKGAAGDESAVAAINEVRAMEVATVRESNVDMVSSVYAPDVEFVPPGEPTLKGADAVREWLAALTEQFDADLEYTASDVEVTGDWAVERFVGTVTLTPKAEGDPVVEQVRGLHVYHRGEDGTWKIRHDVWNSP